MTTYPDLATSLAETARDINAPLSREETLAAIVHAAQMSVPGIDHVGISLVYRDGTIETQAATGQLVWDLDAVQYELDEGPCVWAMRKVPSVLVDDLRHEQRWPAYVPRALQEGLRAQVAVRLFVEDETLGGLNMYSTRSWDVDPDALHAAELFATHAAVALGRLRREEQLSEALASRGLIGQAIGLTMQRFGIDQDRAFQFLIRASSTSNLKVRQIAQEVVEEANRLYR